MPCCSEEGGVAHTCRFAFRKLLKSLQRVSMRSFDLWSNRFLKMEPVPNWNRFLGFGILKWSSLTQTLTSILTQSQNLTQILTII